MMRATVQRSATFLLATFTVGALLLPFAHELTHIRSLEHTHGMAAAEFYAVAAGPAGVDAVDLLVEERTLPHSPNCELCARLTLEAHVGEEPALPLRQIVDETLPTGIVYADRTLASRQIRAPPCVS